jgi:hypothetical protein
LARGDLTRPTDPTIKRLFARSGNRCAFPKCTVEIVQGDTLVGEICHIKAARPRGPRYDPHQTAAERHGYDNLILLCGTHHTVIDDDEEAYTIERLIKMKTDHERTATPIPDDRTASGTQLLIDQSVSVAHQSGGIAAHTINIYAGQPSAPSAVATTAQPQPFPRAQPKDGPARFRAPGDSIGIRDDPFFVSIGNQNSIFLASGSAMWLRLMPQLDPGKMWTIYDLRTVLGHGLALQPFLWGTVYGYGGLYRLRAEEGIGSCALLSPEARETGSVAFAFQTGEVWAIDTWLLAAAPADLLMVDIERLFTQRLQEYAAFLTHLGAQPPYHWIAGVTGIKERRMQTPPPPGQMRVPGWPGAQCLSETVQKEGEYDGQQAANSVLIPFFKAIFDACGVPRPDYLST